MDSTVAETCAALLAEAATLDTTHPPASLRDATGAYLRGGTTKITPARNPTS